MRFIFLTVPLAVHTLLPLVLQYLSPINPKKSIADIYELNCLPLCVYGDFIYIYIYIYIAEVHVYNR